MTNTYSKNKKQSHPIALTIDLEFWWCSEFLKNIPCRDYGDIIEEASGLVLDRLKKHGTKATFFVLGEVAERYPQVIKEIHLGGHEIANHGDSHRNVFEMTPEKFERSVQKSGRLLQSITGQSPKGYRAPNFSFTRKTSWAYDILRQNGYAYSSSLFPFKTKLYGIPEAPLFPYHPSRDNFLKEDDHESFFEFPGTVLQILGKNIPVSGGFYFRVLPLSWIVWGLKRVLAQRPAVFYIHLRDLDRGVPRIKMPPLARFFHYYGLKRALIKFESLLQTFKFDTAAKVLGIADSTTGLKK